METGTINEAVIASYINPQKSTDVHTESLNSILLGILFISKPLSMMQVSHSQN
jgi:hypothetical protein